MFDFLSPKFRAVGVHAAPSSPTMAVEPTGHQRSATVWFVAAWIAILGLLAVMTAPSAIAHDAVIDSNPADGATVSTFPEKIEIKFSGEPRPNFNTFAVTKSEDSTMIAKGSPEINGNTLSLAIPSDVTVTPGEYTIGFQITSSDGHATRGLLKFTYQPDGAASDDAASKNDSADTKGDVDTSSQSSESADNADGGLSTGLIFGLIVLVFVVIGIALIILKKRKN